MTIRTMRVGLHLLTAALVVISVARALMSGTPLVLALGSGVAIFVWYLAGMLVAGPQRVASSAGWWLLGLALLWIGAVIVSPEYLWLAFALWLLAGYVLRWRWAVLFSVVVYAMVAVAPILEFGSTTFAGVIGPLLGGVFALSIARGYLEDLEQGRFSMNVRMLAHPSDRGYLTGLFQQLVVAVLAGAAVLGAIILIVANEGPLVAGDIHLYAVFGFALLFGGFVLGMRSLMLVFKRDQDG
ncbi:hypothetical protein [Paeniglutamicibacter psychrophenolicus]|uniref:hypothetical protein n=1 Tax=Paeniglutamicibacter psychrophenolicus TaxID=257454 RepID=UPI00278BA5AB|nr:hypothetical protein [Paeniglutamicibacter psychrophenolicus]MDQ0095716.1 hypothetical protein [Paeniglutamicibacter psychrophenolicus]